MIELLHRCPSSHRDRAGMGNQPLRNALGFTGGIAGQCISVFVSPKSAQPGFRESPAVGINTSGPQHQPRAGTRDGTGAGAERPEHGKLTVYNSSEDNRRGLFGTDEQLR